MRFPLMSREKEREREGQIVVQDKSWHAGKWFCRGLQDYKIWDPLQLSLSVCLCLCRKSDVCLAVCMSVSLSVYISVSQSVCHNVDLVFDIIDGIQQPSNHVPSSFTTLLLFFPFLFLFHNPFTPFVWISDTNVQKSTFCFEITELTFVFIDNDLVTWMLEISGKNLILKILLGTIKIAHEVNVHYIYYKESFNNPMLQAFKVKS